GAGAGARRQAVNELYASNVALAHRDWLASNPGRVELLLNECPQELRRWEWHYLKRLSGTTGLWTFTLQPMPTAATGVAFSPDGKRLLVGGGLETTSGQARILDAATGQELVALAEVPARVDCGAWAPDGRRVGAAGRDGWVRFWDAATGQPSRTLDAHPGGVTAAAFDPGGERLATAGSDGLAHIWETASGKERLALRGHTRQVRSVAWSPDG